MDKEFSEYGAELVRRLSELAKDSKVDVPDEVRDALAITASTITVHVPSFPQSMLATKLFMAVSTDAYRAGYERGRKDAEARVGRG